MRLEVPVVIALAASLVSCQAPDMINFGRKADGTPRAQIPLTTEARRDLHAAKVAARPPAIQPGDPLPTEASLSVLDGPVTVGLRRDGVTVVAGKAVADDEISARLSFVRSERVKHNSSDVQTITVLTESQVPMDRVFHAMSGGHQAGFTKIGWQLVESVPLPAPEAVAAATDEGTLVVSINPQGATRLGKDVLETAALNKKLQEAVAARKAQSLPPPALTYVAEKGAPPGAIKALLEACETAGITSVTPGSAVPTASATLVPAGTAAESVDFSELYRNWKLGIESRDVDFSEGSPNFWYYALYNGWSDENSMLTQELDSILGVNRERIKFFADKAALHLEQMARIVAAVDADRGKTLKGLGADTRDSAVQAVNGKISFDILKFRLASVRRRVNKEFPPETVSIPKGAKIPPPDKDVKPEEKKP